MLGLSLPSTREETPGMSPVFTIVCPFLLSLPYVYILQRMDCLDLHVLNFTLKFPPLGLAFRLSLMLLRIIHVDMCV